MAGERYLATPKFHCVATPRSLSNAPISEALIDFRVKARKGFEPSEFLSLKPILQAEYPTVEERRAQEMVIDARKSPVFQRVDKGVSALFFSTASPSEVAQFRADGFTLNRLRPYSSFDDLAPRALRLWEEYVRIARPDFVTRIALRYINHIPVPRVAFEITDYLRAGPTVPPELPQSLQRFHSDVTFRDDRSPALAQVKQTLEHEPTTDELRVVFDIDAYLNVANLPAADTQFDASLRELRELKNRIFFESLTDKALEPFEQ